MTVWCVTPNGHFALMLRNAIAAVEILAIFAKNSEFQIHSDMLDDERRLN